MRGRGSALAVVLLLAGCTLFTVPSNPPFAESVSARVEGQTAVFTVEPWPLDDTVAYLCRARPGAEFTGEPPVPATDSGCEQLRTEIRDDVLTATLDVAELTPQEAAEFARSGPPWYLAVAGSRARMWASSVIDVQLSPFPSEAGPS